MDRAIELAIRPKFILNYFDSYGRLIDWVMTNSKAIKNLGGKYIAQEHKLVFPSGSTIILGYGDPNKYLGYHFTSVVGTSAIHSGE